MVILVMAPVLYLNTKNIIINSQYSTFIFLVHLKGIYIHMNLQMAFMKVESFKHYELGHYIFLSIFIDYCLCR